MTTTISRSVDSFYGQMIDDLRGRGFRVVVVTSPGPEIPRLSQRADEVRLIEMARDVSLLKDVRALVRWVRLLRQLRPEIIIGGTPKAGLLSMIASRLVRVPRRGYLLQGLRLEGVHGPKRRVLALMERLSSWCSQVVIAVSPSLAEEYRRKWLHAGRPVVVPNHGSSHGVDTDFFQPRERNIALLNELGLDPDHPVLIFIGRLTADKGPSTLIEALRAVAQVGEHVQLVVVGAQDERDSAMHVTSLREVSERVRVLNHLDDVRPYLAASDLLVLPTLREGMPNVVLEAAAMGVPSITTTATGAIDSVVHDETGLLVPPQDAGALGAAILTLIQNSALCARLGAAARDRAVRDFQPTDVARAIVDHALGVRQPAEQPRPWPPTTFVVTGATGFVGRSIVPILRARGHRVITVGRRGCDLDHAALAGAAIPVGACFVHLAGKAHDLRDDTLVAEYDEVNVDLTVEVWNLARRHRAARFVFMSSIKAVIDHSNGPITEEVEPSPQTPYGASKLRAERAVAALAEQPDSPELTILRPCLIYGPEVKGNLRLLQSLVRLRIPYPLGAFQNSRSVLSIRNLAHVVELAGVGALPAGLYNVADDEPLSTVDIVRSMGAAAGRRPLVLRVPRGLVRLGATVGTMVGGPLTLERLEKMTESLVVDTSRLRRALGDNPLLDSYPAAAKRKTAPPMRGVTNRLASGGSTATSWPKI
ncbi:glycosyltransferase [Nocardioides flavus (ex Wang et al. 2016)]|uniref:glycosyltransferase n=1 Tax=Nocardioides flavus (ex Wang et al. 2016) TaxID=2058780 RepID=UPI001748DB7C|nr:glycosyltransferase [Nocardioides flavus (ex Wang et al. 2016)]